MKTALLVGGLPLANQLHRLKSTIQVYVQLIGVTIVLMFDGKTYSSLFHF